MTFAIVFVSQFAFQYLRVSNTIKIVDGNKLQVVLYSQAIQALWIVSSAIGIQAIFESNILVITAYMIGGGTGTYFGMDNR